MARSKESKKAEKTLSAFEERFSSFGRANKVLTSVRAVPTCFVQFDHATRVGGWPLQRSGVVHGPSNHGKTVFLLGIAGSFLRGGHCAHYVDAERTTTNDWVGSLLGKLSESERFFALRPKSYEHCVDEVRKLHRAIKEARGDGTLPPETSCITIVDSLRKLVPEDIMAKIKKEGAAGEKGSVDGMGGRGAQIRAAMNAAWLDELIPLLDECGTAFAAIARESEDPNADLWAKKLGNDYKVGGGKAVIYDAALVCRIERESWITVPRPGNSEKKDVVGERHLITIKKTKVGGKEDRETKAWFHTSNGRESPAGFDRARDVVDLALRFGVLESEGKVTWPSMGKAAHWRGKEACIKALRDADGDLLSLETEVRSKFEAKAAEEEKDPEAQA